MADLIPESIQIVPEGISVKRYNVKDENRDCHHIAVVSCHGAIPDGSQGRTQCEYIATQCAEWMIRLDANCLILDCRDVDYQWGNSLACVFDRVQDHFGWDWVDAKMSVPIKLLASDRSSGLYSLAPDPKHFFKTIDEAVASCYADLEIWNEV